MAKTDFKSFAAYTIKRLNDCGWNAEDSSVKDIPGKLGCGINVKDRIQYVIRFAATDKMPAYKILIDFTDDYFEGEKQKVIIVHLSVIPTNMFETICSEFDRDTTNLIFTRALKKGWTHDFIEDAINSSDIIIPTDFPAVFINPDGIITSIQRLDESVKYMQYFLREQVRIYRRGKEMTDRALEIVSGQPNPEGKLSLTMMNHYFSRGTPISKISHRLFVFADEYAEENYDAAKEYHRIATAFQRRFKQRFYINTVSFTYPVKDSFDFLLKSKKTRKCSNERFSINEKIFVTTLGSDYYHYYLSDEEADAANRKFNEPKIIPDKTHNFINDLFEFRVYYVLPRKNKALSHLMSEPVWIMPTVDTIKIKADDLNPGLPLQDPIDIEYQAKDNTICLKTTFRYSEFLSNEDLYLEYFHHIRNIGMDEIDDFLDSDTFKLFEYAVKKTGAASLEGLAFNSNDLEIDPRKVQKHLEGYIDIRCGIPEIEADSDTDSNTHEDTPQTDELKAEENETPEVKANEPELTESENTESENTDPAAPESEKEPEKAAGKTEIDEEEKIETETSPEVSEPEDKSSPEAKSPESDTTESNEAVLQKELHSLHRQTEEMETQVLELFDEVEELKKQNKQLERSLFAANMQLDSLKNKKADPSKPAVSLKCDVEEFYDGEIKDKLLGLITREVSQLDGNPESIGIRRYEIFKAIQERNESTGNATKIYDQVQNAFNGIKSSHITAAVKSDLEAAGFVLHEGPHVKMLFQDNPKYCYTLPKTSSDVRAFKNALAIIKSSLLT